MHVEVENNGAEPREVAYRLDGPTGLPIEGAWYASKISPNGFIFPKPVGLRDVAVSFLRNGTEYPELVSSLLDHRRRGWQAALAGPAAGLRRRRRALLRIAC